MPPDRRRNLFARADVGHLAGKLAGGTLASFLPHAADPAAVSAVNKAWRRMRAVEVREAADRIEQTLPERFDLAGAQTLAAQWMERRAELYWGRMRGLYPSDWRIRLDLTGREHLDQALAGGHGAVVWFSSCCDSSLLLRGIAEAGIPLAHLSMAAHGVPSGSRFGRATIGRLHRQGEDRYLRERVVIPKRKDPSYIKRLRELLAANHAVTIRGDLMADSRYLADCLGVRLHIAGGAPSVAFQSRAPLLTAQAERVAPFHYRIVIQEGISASADSRRDFIEEAVAEFGRRLDYRLRDNSPDWDGWWAIDRLAVRP